jgi:hypothetical protein
MAPGIAPRPTAPLTAAQAKKPGHMLMLGTGFVGRYVSERLLAQGWLVRRRSALPAPFCRHSLAGLSYLEFGTDSCLGGRRRVSGTCTSAAKKMELEKLGMDASVFDATRSKYGFCPVFPLFLFQALFSSLLPST